METVDETTESVWNPVARRDPETRPLECSGGRATATYRPWSARERLAYEDTLTTRMLDEDTRGEETVRLGTMKLIALTLTLDSVTGFPPEVEVDDFEVERVPDPDGGKGAVRLVRKPVKRTVPFNPKDERCLLVLDSTTYGELVKHALDVQPLPSAGDDDEDDAADPNGNPADEDPSLTPPTPLAGTAASDEAHD